MEIFFTALIVMVWTYISIVIGYATRDLHDRYRVLESKFWEEKEDKKDD